MLQLLTYLKKISYIKCIISDQEGRMGNILNGAVVEDDINASNKIVSFFDEF